MDLDQALHLERTDAGLRVWYAIADVADVAAFVTAGGALDADLLGEHFDAVVVVDSGAKGGVVQLRDPAVRAKCERGDLPPGDEARVVLAVADPVPRDVVFGQV